MFKERDSAAASHLAPPDPGCPADSVIRQLDTVEFTPEEPGEYEFTCQMGILRGKLVVE